MSMFTLAISCLTSCSLPWFIDLKFQVPIQYCSLQHWNLVYHQTHPQLGVISPWLSLFFPFRAISLLFSSSILDTFWLLRAHSPMQNHSKEKEMQQGKIVVWEGFIHSWRKKRSKKQGKKEKVYPTKRRVPKNSRETRKPSSVNSA